MVRFLKGLQQNDGSTVTMSYEAQIVFAFMLRITAFPNVLLSLYICFKCKNTWGLKSQLCKYIQADSSMLGKFWISKINDT